MAELTKVRFGYAAMTKMRYGPTNNHSSANFHHGIETIDFDCTNLKNLKNMLRDRVIEKFSNYSDETKCVVFDLHIFINGKWVYQE